MHWLLGLIASLSVPLYALLMLPAVLAWERAHLRLDLASRLAAAAALALAYAQLAGMALGFTGLLRPLAVILLLLLGPLLSILIGRKELGLPRLPRPGLPTLLAAAILLLYLLQAAAPPWMRDSLVYHLALPRSFAMAGGYVQPDDNVFASFPLGWESILALLHTLGGSPDRFPPFNPRFIGVWTTGAVALATVGLARSAGVSEKLAPWAAVFLLIVPTVFEFGSSAYVEPLLLLYATLSLLAIVGVGKGDLAFLVPGAVLAGLAASVKYPGLAVCLFLALLLLGHGLRQGAEDAEQAVRRAIRFSLVALTVASPFYLRNLIERGNPFFPVANDLFGGKGWDAWQTMAYSITLENYGQGRSPLDYLLLPFRLFSTTDLRMGFEGSLGLGVGLCLLGGFLLIRHRGPDRRSHVALLAYALLWSLFWAQTVQQARFYLVAVPAVLALGLAYLETLPARRRGATFGLLLAVGSAFFLPAANELWKRQETGAWLRGELSEEAFLSRRLPDTYPPMRELESIVPESGKVWLVWMRGYTYYLRRPYRLDSVFEAYRLEALLDETESPDDFQAALEDAGITHLLIHRDFFLVDGNADLEPGRTARLQRRFLRLVSAGLLPTAKKWGPVELYETQGVRVLVGDE